MIKKLIILLLVITITACSKSVSPSDRVAEYQQPREYNFWYQNQLTLWEKVFGKKDKDKRVIQAEVEVAKSKWVLEKQKEEEKILKEVEAIKSKIK